MTTDNETSSGDWRDNVAALLAAMPHGTWTATTDLGQALGRRASDILTFFAAAHPDGHDRVLSDTGRLRRGAAFKGANRNERASALAEVGIVFDDEGCADPAMRLDVGDLWALAADPDNGVGPGRARRTWLDASGFNDALADRRRITAMVEHCEWTGAAESFASLPNRHLAHLVPHLPSKLVAATGFAVTTRAASTSPAGPAGQARSGEEPEPPFVSLLAARSLESCCIVEAYLLTTPVGTAPVLVTTRPVASMRPLPGPRTPCHRGRHGECRGRYGRGDEGLCQCRCGCTDPVRATTSAHLAKGDQYTRIGMHRRATVRTKPEASSEGLVQLTVKDHISGAEYATTEPAEQLVLIHNPRRRTVA
jgi:hypothetical protein